MLNIDSNKAIINGMNGLYDNKISDSSVRYGKNAAENYLQYMETPLQKNRQNTAPILNFSPTQEADEENYEAIQHFVAENDKYLNSLPPLEFEYRYMPINPVGKVDKKSVLAAAMEEMAAKELSVEEFENRYLIDNETMTAKPLDINKDGKIDISEYATNIIATDLLSKGTTDVSKVDGIINNKGMNAILEYSKKSNAEAAEKLYAEIYNRYELGSALNEIE